MATALTAESTPREIYNICITYAQLCAHRGLPPVVKLLSCISSYNNKHRCATIEAAFAPHRRRTLLRNRRRRDQQDVEYALLNGQQSVTIDEMRATIHALEQQLRTERAKEGDLRDELREWRDKQAATAQSEVEARLELQRVRDREGVPISEARPMLSAGQRALEAFFRPEKRRRY